jgi:hypothetical protein
MAVLAGGSMGAGASGGGALLEAGGITEPDSGGFGIVVGTKAGEAAAAGAAGCWAMAEAAVNSTAEQMMMEIFVRIDGAVMVSSSEKQKADHGLEKAGISGPPQGKYV